MTNRYSLRFVWLSLLCVVTVSLGGCRAKPQAITVCGEVQFDGKPVERGTIDFLPVDGTHGPSAGGQIVNGRYQLSEKDGLVLNGVYSVRIVALRKTGVKTPNRLDPNGPPMELERNFIPAKYNSESTLKIRVADVADPTKVDFQLQK